MIKKEIANTLKIILISTMISLNICIWRDVAEDTFDCVVALIILVILGAFLHERVFRGKRK